MLYEKRKKFEDHFDVPENEWLHGEGWLAPFCKAYGIKEQQQHGEASSVDLEAVEEEHNAAPDCGLAMKQMTGKKKEKLCITITFACNADGSERLPPIYIGRAKKPCCFKTQTPVQHRFYYRNNKKAWMTSELFQK
ncbi:hypothetical protein K439DRAFT_1648810 [Ramaria rubella]|nr:hypothetical protein K439DRAFT_1648810 [Ramaria rubella]